MMLWENVPQKNHLCEICQGFCAHAELSIINSWAMNEYECMQNSLQTCYKMLAKTLKCISWFSKCHVFHNSYKSLAVILHSFHCFFGCVPNQIFPIVYLTWRTLTVWCTNLGSVVLSQIRHCRFALKVMTSFLTASSSTSFFNSELQTDGGRHSPTFKGYFHY